MAVGDILFIIMASLASALFAEGINLQCLHNAYPLHWLLAGISWLLIYRTDSYKQLKNQIDRLQLKGMRL